MRFIIIDNQPYAVSQLRRLLIDLGYEQSQIWPPEDISTFTNWEDVFNKLILLGSQGLDPKQHGIVLFLDLALDEHDKQRAEGMQRIEAHHDGLLKDYVIIAHTIWAGPAKEKMGSMIDGTVDKRHLEGRQLTAKSELEAQLSYAITNWTKRTGRESDHCPPAVTLRDSGSMRVAEASLRTEGIRALASQVTPNWNDVEATSLSGGYSSAHIIRFDGKANGARKSIVCKTTMEKKLLEDELKAWREAYESYPILTGLMPPLVKDVDRIPGTDAWYFVLAVVNGETLEALILDNLMRGLLNDTFSKSIVAVFDALTQFHVASLNTSFTSGVPSRLEMTGNDIMRFQSASEYLLDVASEVARRTYASRRTVPSQTEVADLVAMVKDWKRIIEKQASNTILYAQHGDLNPRNIILASGDHKIQLIDFARFGAWPAGYDLCRLELQLVAKVLDCQSARDVFPDNLKMWFTVWKDLRAKKIPLSSLKPVLSKMNEARAKVEEQILKKGNEKQVTNARALSRLYDAVRICSYQDSSAFKRLLALRIACDCREEAGL